MKKNRFWTIGAVLLSLLLLMAGCGQSGKTQDTGKKISVLYYVNGTLGDKGFFDSAEKGIEKANKELGMQTKTVQGGDNQADWSNQLESLVSSGNYNVVVVGTSQMTDITKDLAKRYPDIKFIFFDDVIKDIPNVYSMLYSQSEGSFLAGAFASLVTESKDLKATNPDKTIGFVGGMDIPIINDFKAGYEQGAHYIDPNVKVVASYIGDFSNAPKAKELTLAQFNTQNVDISFQVAGGAGLGVLEAAKGVGKYSIGVDSNQNSLYPGSVLTSMLKNIDTSVFRALDLYKQGKLQFGKNEVLGIKEGGIGLAKDNLYDKYVPQSIRDKMKEIETKLSTGEIKVTSILK